MKLFIAILLSLAFLAACMFMPVVWFELKEIAGLKRDEVGEVMLAPVMGMIILLIALLVGAIVFWDAYFKEKKTP
jgi:UDP-N-acetylmuramyl pentapeptide phosphotransferase/UDP-N-acetylglucosamine-1-phosphate transferase